MSASTVLDNVVRVYKNTNSKVIAIDDVTIFSETHGLETMGTFFVSLNFKVNRTIIAETGEPKVVSTVKVIGNFDSISVDLNELTYLSKGSEIDQTLDISGSVLQVGDTV